MQLIIDTTSNGYLLTVKGEISTDDEVICVENPDDDEKAGLKNLLGLVAENLGETYDKWANDNLVISFTGKGLKIE